MLRDIRELRLAIDAGWAKTAAPDALARAISSLSLVRDDIATSGAASDIRYGNALMVLGPIVGGLIAVSGSLWRGVIISALTAPLFIVVMILASRVRVTGIIVHELDQSIYDLRSRIADQERSSTMPTMNVSMPSLLGGAPTSPVRVEVQPEPPQRKPQGELLEVTHEPILSKKDQP
jgi:hypothetical protein